MDDKYQQAVIAVAAIQQLTGMHKRFVEELATASQAPSDIGSLSANLSAITCSCHGHKFTASPRPVVIEGQVAALEYEFVVSWKGDDLPILRLYLQSNGIVSFDVKGATKFQDFNNTYMKKHLLVALSEALLKSAVFKPNAG